MYLISKCRIKGSMNAYLLLGAIILFVYEEINSYLCVRLLIEWIY